MSNVENIKIGNTVYPIRDKNTLRSLSTAQETQLLIDGTYNGEDVEDGEVFTQEDGTFKEFKKEQVTSIETGVFTGGIQAWGCFKGKCFSMKTDNSGMSLYLSDNGKTWTSTGVTNDYVQQKVMITPTSAVVFNTRSGDTTITGIKTTDGTNWTSTTVYFPVPGFLQNGVFYNFDGKVIFVDDYNATTNYFISTDDGVTWTSYSYPDGFQGAAGQDNKFALLGDKLYLISGSGQLFETSDGINWTLDGSTTIPRGGVVAGDYYFYESGLVLYYSTDMVNTSHRTFPLSSASGFNIAYSKGIYVICNTEYLSISTDNLVTFNTETQYNSSYAGGAGFLISPTFIECLATYWQAQTANYGLIATEESYNYSLKDLSGVGTGDNAPQQSTEGYIGKLYVTDGGAVYICTGVSGSTYTWAQITLS